MEACETDLFSEIHVVKMFLELVSEAVVGVEKEAFKAIDDGVGIIGEVFFLKIICEKWTSVVAMRPKTREYPRKAVEDDGKELHTNK